MMTRHQKGLHNVLLYAVVWLTTCWCRAEASVAAASPLLRGGSFRQAPLSPPLSSWESNDNTTLSTNDHHEQDHRSLVSQGNVKVLVLLVRFSNHVDRNLPEKSYFETLFNGVGSSDINPVGGASEYYYYSSMGMYNVTFDVVQDWRTLDQPESYFANGESGRVNANRNQEMAYSSLDAIYNSGYDFSTLSSDGTGRLDHLVIVHSGYPAEYLGVDCDDASYENRMWSQGTRAVNFGWQAPDNGGFSASRFMVAGAFHDGKCNENPVEMGTVVHEYMHGFGLYDLYDQDPDGPPILVGGTGRFGLMSNLHGWNRNEKIPGHLNAFSRDFVGWLEPIEITEDGVYPIQPCEISSQVYVIRNKFPFGEYLYLENRQQILWDSNWRGSGLVIYKIDDNADRQRTRGFPGHPNWPAEHYQVSVLQKDGNYDIENGNNPGDEGDFWVKGDVLSPGGEWPNTDGYSFGNRQETGILIEVLTDSSFTMLVRVTGVST